MPELRIPRIINAAGHLSMLGGGVTPPDLARKIASAVDDALSHPVEVAALKDELSRRIAAATGAEAGCVTTGAAAGIALSVAACVAGNEPGAVHSLPDSGQKPVVIQSGHDIDFGAPVVQMIRLGGGTPVIVGSPSYVTPIDLDRALSWAAAMLFVQSHHVRVANRLDLETCIAAAHAVDVPVIVDAAAEEDLRAYIAAGADLVIYSGGKALGALSSSGFVAGRAGLVAAMRAHERGIGRPMKVGPEQLVALAVALDAYAETSTRDLQPLLEGLVTALGEIAAAVSIVPDEAGRAIRRVEVRHARAPEIVAALRKNDPPIYVRAHNAAQGRFLIDVRNLRPEDVPVIAEALRVVFGTGGSVD